MVAVLVIGFASTGSTAECADCAVSADVADSTEEVGAGDARSLAGTAGVVLSGEALTKVAAGDTAVARDPESIATVLSLEASTVTSVAAGVSVAALVAGVAVRAGLEDELHALSRADELSRATPTILASDRWFRNLKVDVGLVFMMLLLEESLVAV